VKQKTAKPGDPIADASTEIGSEAIEIPDISEALKAAQTAKEQPPATGPRRRFICPICNDPRCIHGEIIGFGTPY